ncbi:hypothetical protein COR50_21730 [Chitinophaga caeni]|uniref:DUF4738 domain-containing protein n=1 Tax=Chitinophaga caeni TaxID=2029983 RepID=A0A291R0F6_9BACT|nr:hypothetical protein [Chitinophaga caeni]ATL49583.1 hypothetical protein COR50_21730 [Chitinophaga caeni]
MNKYLFLFVATFFISSCIDSQTKRGHFKTNDSTTLDEKVENGKKNELENDEELITFVKTFEKLLLDTVVVDSVFDVGSDKITFSFKHYANQAKTMLIPDKYTRVYGLSHYKVPEFVSSIQLSRNSSIILDTILQKPIFYKILPVELIEYGAMLYPVISFEEDGLVIKYSISIPLTDIGKKAILRMDYLGRLAIDEE